MDGIANQYRTIASGAGWIRRRASGFLHISGPDAIEFLQGLVTNDLSQLSATQAVYAAHLTPQGRMIADLEIYSRPDGLLARVPPGRASELAVKLDQLVFAEDVRVADVSTDWVVLTVVGSDAARVLQEITGVPAGAWTSLGELQVLDWPDGMAARSGDALLPIFDLFIRAGSEPALRDRLQSSGAFELSGETVDLLRIEAGRPKWGAELAADVIPLEAGLIGRAISTTKGCYVGQEVIIRILHRGGGRVARRLVRFTLEMDDDALPAEGTAVVAAGGEDAGKITSVARNPATGQIVALGYVRSEHARPGVRLGVSGGGHIVVTAPVGDSVPAASG